jgi:hypothetical protein
MLQRPKNLIEWRSVPRLRCSAFPIQRLDIRGHTDGKFRSGVVKNLRHDLFIRDNRTAINGPIDQPQPLAESIQTKRRQHLFSREDYHTVLSTPPIGFIPR